MNLTLEDDEIGIVAVSLAHHIGYGTEDDDTENFVEAGRLCLQIANCRTSANRDNITLYFLTDEQVRVILISVNYAYSFYDIFKGAEMSVVRDILIKLGDEESIERFDTYAEEKE